MSLLIFSSFICLLFNTIYYFLYQNKLNLDNLFIIILNFIFISILPLYYFHFDSIIYSLITSFCLFLTSFFLNLQIKELFHKNKITLLIYFLLTLLMFSKILLISIH